jgi:hypothetical protein
MKMNNFIDHKAIEKETAKVIYNELRNPDMMKLVFELISQDPIAKKDMERLFYNTQK